MASVIKKPHKNALRRSLPVKAEQRPRSHTKPQPPQEFQITGDVNVLGNIFIDNRRSVKIQHSGFKKLFHKFKPIGD